MASKRPDITIHDLQKNLIVVREMDDTEYAQHLIDIKNWEIKKELENKKIEARKSALAKLAALGLTEEEIAAL